MPAILDWKNDPLSVIDQIYDENDGREEWCSKVPEYFCTKMKVTEAIEKLPSIPETPLHELRDGQLVRFRCMLQDCYDPEYFVSSYTVEDASGSKKSRTSCFREIFSCGIGEKIIEDEQENAMEGLPSSLSQRKICYCVSIPGQNDWLTEEVRKQSQSPMFASSKGGCKRVRDDDQRNDDSMDITDSHNNQSDDSKRMRPVTTDPMTGKGQSGGAGAASNTSGGSEQQSSPVTRHEFNFPIDSDKAIACLVKFYGEDDEELGYAINDTLEIIGVVCLNPSLAAVEQEDNEPVNGMTDNRGPASHMPPSLVPRLHAVWSRRVSHCNSLLPASVSELPVLSVEDMAEGRELLRSVLEEACLGDPLAGDFLITNIIASVYSRRDLSPVGQYPLSISGITPSLSEAGFATRLYALLQQLTTHSHFLPLSTENLNENTFIPKKDYIRNELRSGVLQLSKNTMLVIDETAMQAGTLQSRGIQNLEQISNVLRNQMCKYDFQYHKIEMNTDINVLVLSEGRSMLSVDSELVLCPQHDNVTAAYEKVHTMLSSDDMLTTIRKYITTARLVDYCLSNDMQQKVQNDFVEARQRDKNAMTPENFMELLSLSRLISMSCGEKDLTERVWHSSKILDTKRTDRITALNRPPRVAM